MKSMQINKEIRIDGLAGSTKTRSSHSYNSFPTLCMCYVWTFHVMYLSNIDILKVPFLFEGIVTST